MIKESLQIPFIPANYFMKNLFILFIHSIFYICPTQPSNSGQLMVLKLHNNTAVRTSRKWIVNMQTTSQLCQISPVCLDWLGTPSWSQALPVLFNSEPWFNNSPMGQMNRMFCSLLANSSSDISRKGAQILLYCCWEAPGIDIGILNCICAHFVGLYHSTQYIFALLLPFFHSGSFAKNKLCGGVTLVCNLLSSPLSSFMLMVFIFPQEQPQF